MRFRSFAPWILVAAPIAIPAFGCYGATQVTVALSTDLTCDGTVDTLLYKGSPHSLDSTPNAETRSCTKPTAAGADSDIGSLTLTPSNNRNAQVEVKAVLARNGKDPSKCDVDATDCIIATRTFSFSEHTAQTIPIRLLADCLGTACPEGQTCIAAGQCTTNSVTCTDPGGCTDAGADAGPDGGAPGGACEARGNNGILATSTSLPGDQLSTIVRGPVVGSIYWYEGANLRHVLTSGVVENGKTASAGTIALADGHDSSVVSLVAGTTGSAFLRGQKRTIIGDVGVAVAASSSLGVVAGSKGLFVIDDGVAGGPTAALQPTFSLVASRLALANGTLYAASATAGVHVIDLSKKSDMEFVPRLGPMSGAIPFAFAVTPTAPHVYVAGIAKATGVATIVSLTDSNVAPYSPSGAQEIHSLALDESRVYWTHGDDGVTALDANRVERVVYPAKGTTVTNVNVDDDCVYFWESTADGGGALHAVGKLQ